MKSTNKHPNYLYIYNMTCWPSSSRYYKICVITWWMESPAVWMTLSMCMWVRGSFLLDLKLVHLQGCCMLIGSWRQESLSSSRSLPESTLQSWQLLGLGWQCQIVVWGTESKSSLFWGGCYSHFVLCGTCYSSVISVCWNFVGIIISTPLKK